MYDCFLAVLCRMYGPFGLFVFLCVFFLNFYFDLSHIMRKPAFCIRENKGADQLRGNQAADQPLCFCYMKV